MEQNSIRYFAYAVIVVVVIAVIAGLFVVGSPLERRAERFDEERVSDLQRIQGELLSYWLDARDLPESINILRDELRGFVPPVDPQTGQEYEYTRLSDVSFELCSEFNRAGESDRFNEYVRPVPGGGTAKIGDSWAHEAGRTCFTREIDPERYPEN